MQPALIIGGDSAIGSALAAHLTQQGKHVNVTSRKPEAMLKLDLADAPEHWPQLPAADVAFLCAAATGLDACENDPVSTAHINVTHMQLLATKLFAQGMYVVFLSSNQVFDGQKPYRHAQEATCPANEYGKQKAAFEAWLIAQPYSASVLRLTKVIAGRLPILEAWSQSLRQGMPVEAFTDLVFAPLPLAHVLEGLSLLYSQKPHGIFQLSGTHDISYYEIASHLAATLQIDAARIIRTSAVAAGIKPQFLPRHGTLAQSDIFTVVCPEPLKVLGF